MAGLYERYDRRWHRQARYLCAEVVFREEHDHEQAAETESPPARCPAWQRRYRSWATGPGRRAAGDRRPRTARSSRPPLELRLDGRRDNVALLYFLALISVADHLGHGLVGLDRDDLGFADVFGAGSGAEDEQLVADDEAVVGADRQFDAAVGGIDPLDFPLNGRRALQSLDLADVVGQSVLCNKRRELGDPLAQVGVVLGGRVERPFQIANLVVKLGLVKLELVRLFFDRRQSLRSASVCCRLASTSSSELLAVCSWAAIWPRAAVIWSRSRLWSSSRLVALFFKVLDLGDKRGFRIVEALLGRFRDRLGVLHFLLEFVNLLLLDLGRGHPVFRRW